MSISYDNAGGPVRPPAPAPTTPATGPVKGADPAHTPTRDPGSPSTGRPTDQAFDGAKFWDPGEGLRDVQKLIPLADKSLLDTAYQALLGRPADGQGLQTWGEQIATLRDAGKSPAEIQRFIEDHIKGSPEYQKKHFEPVTPATPGTPAPAGATAGVVPPDNLAGSPGGQCVVFVEAQTGHYFPVESAKQMLEPDKHPGYSVVQTPQPGDIFVSTNGPDGHTGIVKSVNADGSITVIDSNSNYDETVKVHDYPAGRFAGYLRPNGEPTQPYGK